MKKKNNYASTIIDEECVWMLKTENKSLYSERLGTGKKCVPLYCFEKDAQDSLKKYNAKEIIQVNIYFFLCVWISYFRENNISISINYENSERNFNPSRLSDILEKEILNRGCPYQV